MNGRLDSCYTTDTKHKLFRARINVCEPASRTYHRTSSGW